MANLKATREECVLIEDYTEEDLVTIMREFQCTREQAIESIDDYADEMYGHAYGSYGSRGDVSQKYIERNDALAQE